MTTNEAKIVLLESALRQAQHTVVFLHNCLIDTKMYSYEYPEQTIQYLKEWAKLAPIPEEICPHSSFNEDCAACKMQLQQMQQFYEAKKVLNA